MVIGFMHACDLHVRSIILSFSMKREDQLISNDVKGLSQNNTEVSPDLHENVYKMTKSVAEVGVCIYLLVYYFRKNGHCSQRF